MAKPYLGIKPYKKGYLSVGNGHELYYELCGNPKGRPVVFLHGGPGAGIGKTSRRFFNPKKFNVLLFDQRGCGKSRPFGSMKTNNTGELVKDVKKLLDFFGFEKAFIFGGSWGSALAMAYAINYPETVSGMLLRGIFLSDSSDINYSFEGPAKHMFSEQVERFMSNVPKKSRKNPFAFYAKKISSKKAAERKKFAFEYLLFENRLLSLKFDENSVFKKIKNWDYYAWALIESSYLAEKCFLPEKYILKNAKKISGIPVSLVQGRYDMVCSPKSAIALHKALPKSRLFIVTAGHSASDPEIQSKLVEEMDKAAEQL